MGKEESNVTTEEQASSPQENKSNPEKPVSDSGKNENTESSNKNVEVESKDTPAPKENKEDLEKIRTVIKLKEGDEEKGNSQDEKKTEEETKSPAKEEDKEEKSTPNAQEGASSPREELEQKRSILQNIKDFDYQIKKNKDDITQIHDKIEGLTKDLDDLVSLYEIVSEQMNPFVGLSKVTKKRIDALENFMQEIEDIKTRMSEIESVVEKGIGGIKRLTKRLDFKDIQRPVSNKIEESLSELEKETEETKETDKTPDDGTGEIKKKEPEIKSQDKDEIKDLEKESVVSEPEIKEKVTVIDAEVEKNRSNFSDNEIDILLMKSLENIIVEQAIDSIISDFLLNLK